MPKRGPEERWRDHVLEGYQAFRASKEFEELRRKGLRALGRTKLFTFEEWYGSFGSRVQNEQYMAFVRECRVVGERFNLQEWNVAMACLVRGYQPDQGGLAFEANYPQVRVVIDTTDELFLRWLLYEATQLGLVVVVGTGTSEVSVVLVPVYARPEEPLTAAHRPALDCAFSVRVETPPLYPPEAAAELHRRAQQAARELLRRLGYRVPDRLRKSQLPSLMEELRIGKKLSSAETAEIVDDIYGDKAGDDADLRRRVKDRRHKLKRRLEGHDEADRH